MPVILTGLIFDLLSELLAVAFFIHIVWHYLYLKKLNNWLWNSKSTILPDGKYEWEHAFIGIYNLQQRLRKRRKKLAQMISRFREGAEALPDAVVVFQKGGEIIWCNHLAQVQLGFKWPGDGGENITNLIRNPDFVVYLKKEDFHDPLGMISPINPDKYLEFRVMPYAKSQRLLIVRDITAYRQVDQTRREFVANVSHELRTPLTVLQGYIEILNMQAEPDTVQGKAITVLEQQTERMCSLVEQLMVLSKIESAPTLDLDEQVDIAALLAQIEDEACSLGEKKELSIVFNVDKNLRLLGNEMQIRSAMTNLIYNAVKYTPLKGNIRVDWQRVDHEAYFSVTDDGDGIPSQHILHLTERFYRVDQSRSRDTGGTGLGLSIVKHVLSHYDSELVIESKVHKGSQFSFIIPESYVLI